VDLLLAALPPAERDGLIPAHLPAHTAHTITERSRLDAALDQVAREGLAVIDQELEIGLRSVAVPVRDSSGRVVAALNLGAHALEYGVEDLRQRIAPCLALAAQRMTRSLRG